MKFAPDPSARSRGSLAAFAFATLSTVLASAAALSTLLPLT
jgi:hypothetical protein